MACMRAAVDPLPGTPLPNGLLGECANVEEVSGDRLHELAGGVEWLDFGCLTAHPWEDPCRCRDDESGEEESEAEEPQKKEFQRPEWRTADPITIYAGIECSTFGLSYPDAVEQARSTLRLGQQRALEEAFWRRHMVEEAEDVTPIGEEGESGALDIVQAVSVLEGLLAETFGGRGTVIIPAGLAAIAGRYGLIHRDGACGDCCLQTLAGNRVLISAGASAANVGPDGEEADPGEAWVMVTGPIRTTLGPEVIVPPDSAASIDVRTNTRRALVERSAIVRTTCGALAARVSTCPVC